MTDIHIPEELEEMIRQIIAYENATEEEVERIREWLYIDPPNSDSPAPEQDPEDGWKIEISI